MEHGGRRRYIAALGGGDEVGGERLTSQTYDASPQPPWSDLLHYYRECLLSEDTKPQLLSVEDHGRSYVCLTGSERLLSGDLDQDDCAPCPEEAVALVEGSSEQDAELWAGYPVVVLASPGDRRRSKELHFAPLLARRVEIVDTEGEKRLKPYGPVLPHPELAEQRLGKEGAALLADTYQPTWQAGEHGRMAAEACSLLDQEYELRCVQDLIPDRLADRIDTRTPAQGAQNVAVLFLSPRDTTSMKKGLLEDLRDIAEHTDEIKKTALAAMSPEPAEREQALTDRTAEPDLVIPLQCNEAQEDVLRTAMTQRLTVATGPPGTGKSQLISNLVATAVTRGHSVLVASTNNGAVDEVWARCEKLCPGSMVRTGSASGKKDYTKYERDSLNALREATPPTLNVRTADTRLKVASEHLEQVRQEYARVARSERTLRLTGEAREQHAARLCLPIAELADLVDHSPSLDQLARRATRLAQARFLGGWRRSRLLRQLGIPAHSGDPKDACTALAAFATDEATWRSERVKAANEDDDDLIIRLSAAETDFQAASADLLKSTIHTNASKGRQRIASLLNAGGRRDWTLVKEALPAVRAWAVTSLSVRRRFLPKAALFDLVIIDEASQCSIPHVIPLLYRARRALIIGDVKQLTHITTIDPEHEGIIRQSTGIRAEWLQTNGLNYRDHSSFRAAERAAGDVLLLDEHFRCHPAIAAVSNDLFYGGRLEVLTDIRGRPSVDQPPISWIDIAGHAAHHRGKSWINRDEARAVEAIVRDLLNELPSRATIGIVTPFKGQVGEVSRRLGVYDRERVRIGTVHSFQGGEYDVVVLSLVAGPEMRRGTLGWIDGDPSLWNVAITRARSHLIVVGTAGLWRRRGGVAAALLDAAGDHVPTAENDKRDELLKRLYKRLSEQPSAKVTLGVTVNGHQADAVVHGETGAPTAVVLDPGPGDVGKAARHLRLMLRRRSLLDGGDHGGGARRYPAWKLYDHEASE